MNELVRYELDDGQILYNYDHVYKLGQSIDYSFSEFVGFTDKGREVRRFCGRYTAMVVGKHIME